MSAKSSGKLFQAWDLTPEVLARFPHSGKPCQNFGLTFPKPGRSLLGKFADCLVVNYKIEVMNKK
jgi:hypothetical protein